METYGENALGLIKKGNIIKEGISNIVSKKTEIQRVETVELKRHAAHTCPLKDVGTRQSPLQISHFGSLPSIREPLKNGASQRA